MDDLHGYEPTGGGVVYKVFISWEAAEGCNM